MSKNLLSLQNISLTYSQKNSILCDISFSVSQGEILSIIGKNGTGKSTLLKIMAGIEKWYTGTVTKYTKKISYVPQKLELEKSFPLSVKEFFLLFHESVNPEKLAKVLSLFEIETLLKQNIHNLSWGEFQKVLLSNAILSDPELLLLDEPTTGIDVIGEELFYKNISLLRESFPELAIVLVSHNLRLVYKHSTRVICLHDNNFCCHGTPNELSENADIKAIFWDYLSPYEHHPHDAQIQRS